MIRDGHKPPWLDVLWRPTHIKELCLFCSEDRCSRILPAGHIKAQVCLWCLAIVYASILAA